MPRRLRIGRPLRFSGETTPCVPLEEVFLLLHSFATVINSARPVTDPVMRYGRRLHERCLDGDYRPLIAALDVWLHGAKRSSLAAYYLGSALREKRRDIERLGLTMRDVYYYMRYLGLYLTADDVRVVKTVIPHASRGFLYWAFKVIWTGEYPGRQPIEFQVEVALTTPAFELVRRGEDWYLCLERDYLLAVSDQLLDDAAMLTVEFYGDSQFANLVDTIKDNWYVLGIEWVRSGVAWGFERQTYVRWCAIFIQKANLYGGYWQYFYGCWIVRRVYPHVGSEAWDMLQRGRVAEARRLFIGYVDIRGREEVPPPRAAASALYDSGGYDRLVEQMLMEAAEVEARRRAALLAE